MGGERAQDADMGEPARGAAPQCQPDRKMLLGPLTHGWIIGVVVAEWPSPDVQVRASVMQEPIRMAAPGDANPFWNYR